MIFHSPKVRTITPNAENFINLERTITPNAENLTNLFNIDDLSNISHTDALLNMSKIDDIQTSSNGSTIKELENFIDKSFCNAFGLPDSAKPTAGHYLTI